MREATESEYCDAKRAINAIIGGKNMTKDEKRRRELVNSYNFEKWLKEEQGFGGPSAANYCNGHFGKEGDSYFSQFKHETLYGDYGKQRR